MDDSLRESHLVSATAVPRQPMAIGPGPTRCGRTTGSSITWWTWMSRWSRRPADGAADLRMEMEPPTFRSAGGGEPAGSRVSGKPD